MVGLSRVTNTGRRVLSEVSEKNVTFMAAGIAYNAFVSLAPMLLLLLFVVSAVGGGLEERVVTLAQDSLPGPIAGTVEDVFRGSSTAAGASFVGLVALIWGTLKIFRGLDTAFSEIYETEEQNSFVDQLEDGIVVLVALVAAVVATVGVSSVFAARSDAIPFLDYVTPGVLVVGLVLAFLPMYYKFPDTDVDWRHVVPGVVFAAVGWAGLQGLFQVYLTFKGGGSGSFFGGVILVVTWLYFSGIVLLLGAVINAVLGNYATGAAGGVGRGATSTETEREESMSRDEFGQYLQQVREQVAGRHERPYSTLGGERGDRYPAPDGKIEVTEITAPTADGETWTVQFEWQANDTGSGRGSRSRSDEQRRER
ncbi:YihY/virulence factor BrkB family protein [Halogeometricum limi]|uniref:Membrane protein n=1 Tax=Halogeometricum limi TaxID=555875 RepID=A0A1I6ICT6_9EURY|nr:YihY/virulence factor BrkB family protein [Halogeometricum limi]SFR64429.1 membrane protein [Halogeometricum limi]